MSENPFEPPMAELAESPSEEPLPASAYVTAVASFIFVVFGATFVLMCILLLLAGRPIISISWLASGFVISLMLSSLLGALSAWQSLRQSRRKMDASRKKAKLEDVE